MIALFAVEAVVVLAAFVCMFWLKREAHKRWAFHVATRQMRKDFIRLQIQIADHLTPALQRMAQAVAEMAPTMQRLGEAIKKESQR